MRFDDFFNEKMENPEIKKEYENLELNFRIANEMIKARTKNGLTQKDLSSKTGIAQGDISKLESGSGNPSIKTLKRLASGMKKFVDIVFKDSRNDHPVIISNDIFAEVKNISSAQNMDINVCINNLLKKALSPEQSTVTYIVNVPMELKAEKAAKQNYIFKTNLNYSRCGYYEN